jgi:hypothetical protein
MFNTQIFGLIGYISIGVALLVPLCWLFHWMAKRKKWMVHIALFFAIVAFGLAKYNSLVYVGNIEEDMSEQMAAAAKREADKRRKLEKERESEVAKIRFAEDDAGDFIDKGGMDETDLRLHGLKKKERSEKGSVDNSLTGSINTEEKKDGMKTEDLEENVEPSAVLKRKDYDLAQLVDGLNLKTIRWLIMLTLCYIFIDYLKRGNKKDQAYFPIPLPSSWFNAFTPLHAPINEAIKRTKPVIKDLRSFAKRNETFLYLSDSNLVDSIPETLPKFMNKKNPMDILPLSYKDNPIHEDFIFESLWYARSSFYSDDIDDSKSLLIHFISLMAERKEARAHTIQNVHIIWDFTEPLPENTCKLFSQLGNETGIYLHILTPTA